MARVTTPQAAKYAEKYISAELERTCEEVFVGNQSVHCTVNAHDCPNFKVICGTEADIQLSCSLGDVLQATDAMRKLIVNDIGNDVYKLAPDSARRYVTALNTIGTQIKSSCASENRSKQTVLGNPVCRGSKNLDLSFIAKLDATGQCALGEIVQAANEADLGVQKPSAALNILIGVAVVTLLIIIIMFTVRGITGNKKAAAGK